MATPVEQWLAQADYDFETAEAMYASGRYIYAVFMAHLALEKALKGLNHRAFGEYPPKTHNLVFLAARIGLEPPRGIARTLVDFNGTNLTTRYPKDLDKAIELFPRNRVRAMLDEARRCIQWIKQQS